MNRLTVMLPDPIHAQLKHIARREGVSVNQYVTFAIASQLERADIPAKPTERPKAEASQVSSEQ